MLRVTWPPLGRRSATLVVTFSGLPALVWPSCIGKAPDAAQIADIEIAVMEGQAMRIDKTRRARQEGEALVRLAVAIGVAQHGDLAAGRAL